MTNNGWKLTTPENINADVKDMEWNDKISSIKVEESGGDNLACFYQENNYNGYKQCLGVGNYPFVADVGINDDDISSLKVPDGLTVSLYEDSN